MPVGVGMWEEERERIFLISFVWAGGRGQTYTVNVSYFFYIFLVISSGKQTNHSSPAASFCAVFGRLGAAKHPHCCSCLTFPVLDISLPWNRWWLPSQPSGCSTAAFNWDCLVPYSLLPYFCPSPPPLLESTATRIQERGFERRELCAPGRIPGGNFPAEWGWLQTISLPSCQLWPNVAAEEHHQGETVRYKSKQFVAPLPFPTGAANPEEIAPMGDEEFWFLLGALHCTPRTWLSHARSHLPC